MSDTGNYFCFVNNRHNPDGVNLIIITITVIIITKYHYHNKLSLLLVFPQSWCGNYDEIEWYIQLLPGSTCSTSCSGGSFKSANDLENYFKVTMMINTTMVMMMMMMMSKNILQTCQKISSLMMSPWCQNSRWLVLCSNSYKLSFLPSTTHGSLSNSLNKFYLLQVSMTFKVSLFSSCNLLCEYRTILVGSSSFGDGIQILIWSIGLFKDEFKDVILIIPWSMTLSDRFC